MTTLASSAMIARPYQVAIINQCREALRKYPSALVVLPTGGGKTVIFSLIAKGIMQRGRRVLILVHRSELLKQTSRALLRCGVPHGIIASGVPETVAHVQVGMVATVKNRLGRIGDFDLIITDECHHTPAAQYVAIENYFKRAKRLGFTATPDRLDKRPLPYHKLIIGSTIGELITDGWLVTPIVYAPPIAADLSKLHTRMGDFIRQEMSDALDRPSITGDVVAHYKRIVPGTAAAAFCVSIDHARHVAETFSSAGVPATSIDGNLSPDEREYRLTALADGRIQVLTSCDLISEGFDLPRLETAILLRPTQSLAMYLQQIGRALRPDHERGKRFAYIFDHVGNCARHGLPDDDRDWSDCLEPYEKRKKKVEDEEAEITLKICPDCFMSYRGTRCPGCGSERGGNGREIDEVEGELVMVEQARKYVDLTGEEWRALKTAANAEELHERCKALNIDEKWATKLVTTRWKTLEEGLRIEKQMGYKPGWAKHRYIARHSEEGYKEAMKALLKGESNEGNTAQEVSA